MKAAELVQKYGEVPPPWMHAPRMHPMHIYWRMGSGEAYRLFFWNWALSLDWDESVRIEYMRRWDPPYSWLDTVADFIWSHEVIDADEPPFDYFERLEELGFGTHADWSRCFGAPEQQYPLPEDTCARWDELAAI